MQIPVRFGHLGQALQDAAKNKHSGNVSKTVREYVEAGLKIDGYLSTEADERSAIEALVSELRAEGVDVRDLLLTHLKERLVA